GDAFPTDAILGEEGPDDPARLGRERVWIVDPLDGTRDFLARTGDFCVHVALAFRGRPVGGVVRHEVPELSAHAVVGQGAWIGQTRLAVSTSASAARVGVSRQSCPPPLAAALGDRARPSGASVKYLALARGELDGILTLTPGEKEWDTCAPELVVLEAGGRVTGGDGRAFAYNQRDLGRPTGIVASNGLCHDELLSLVTRCA